MTDIYSQFAPDINSAYYFTPQNVGFATPQTADFVRYGNINVNHYNGLLDFEIPLYEYKDRDFEIPISLKYISEGFKPSKRPSLVGYNWLLNVGGIITREVVGSPDDTEGFYYDNVYVYMPDGVLAMDGKSYQKYYSQNELWGTQMTKTKNGNPYHFGDFERDFAPDIFHFSFGKHKGSFIITNETFPTLLTGKEYKIEISGITAQPYTRIAPEASKILIYTPDGYKYEFGGNTSYLEYLIPNNPIGVKQKPTFIISWYLKSITAPNGRTATFSYTSTEQKNKYTYHMSNDISSSILISRSPAPPAVPVQSVPGINWPSAATIEIDDKIFVPLLDKIEIDDTTIEFNRNKFGYPFHSTETTNDLWYLDFIELKYNSTLVKNIDFSYKTKGKYFFLDELNLNKQDDNKQIYEFDYYLEQTLPDPQTISVDHWGFWNGGYSITEDARSYLNNILDRKNVNISVFNTGLLKSIIYPTGGETEIEYEYNRFQHYKVKDKQIIHLQDVFSDIALPCGGARVKKVKDYDPVNNIVTNERTFLYRKPNESNESGVIATLPIYASYDMIMTIQSFTEMMTNHPNPPIIIFCLATTTTLYLTMSSNTVGTENNISEYHIGYSDVMEQFNDGSFVHYHFSSLIDVPDDENVNSYHLSAPISGQISRLLSGTALNDKFGVYKVNDMSKYRGKLLNKKTYSSTNNIVEEEIYTYNLEEAKNEYAISVTSLPAGVVANKIFTIPCRLIQYERIESNVSNKITYKYNDRNLISEEETVDSMGKETLKKNKYITDYVLVNTYAPDRTLFWQMINRNMIGCLSEEQLLIKKDDSWNLLKGKLIRYGCFRNCNVLHQELFKPKEEYILETSQPLTEFITSELVGAGFLTFDPHYKKRTIYNYNTIGNLVHVEKDDVENVVYLWGYNYQYPIAKIENATYSNVCEIIGNGNEQTGKNTLETIAGKIEPTTNDFNTINSLRNLLPDAIVTTYKYKPLIGLETVTSPGNKTTTYKYDSFGRLESIKDHNGKIIEQYDYHYKNQ